MPKREKELKRVVKVQRPMMPPDDSDNALCLVYSKNHEFMTQQQIPLAAMQSMKARPGIFAHRAFFEAEFDWFKAIWKIGKIREDQAW